MLGKFFLHGSRKEVLRSANEILSTPVGNLMTEYVVTTKPDVGIVQAATRMIAQSISCIVVVDKKESRMPIGNPHLRLIVLIKCLLNTRERER